MINSDLVRAEADGHTSRLHLCRSSVGNSTVYILQRAVTCLLTPGYARQLEMNRLRAAFNLSRIQRLSMVAAAASRITVSLPEPAPSTSPTDKPSHWLNDEGTLFHNPWPSFKKVVRTSLSLQSAVRTRG